MSELCERRYIEVVIEVQFHPVCRNTFLYPPNPITMSTLDVRVLIQHHCTKSLVALTALTTHTDTVSQSVSFNFMMAIWSSICVDNQARYGWLIGISGDPNERVERSEKQDKSTRAHNIL